MDSRTSVNLVQIDANFDLKLAQLAVHHLLNSEDICIFAQDLKNGTSAFGSHGAEKIYGYSSEEFRNDPLLWKKLIHSEDVSIADKVSLTDPPPIRTEYRIIRKDGQVRWVANSLYPQLDDKGRPISLTGITIDITKYQQRLRSMAFTDFLTQLPNRHQFDEDISTALNEALEYDDQTAIIYVDFDGFKRFNDKYGHQFGDDVLRHIAKLLREFENVRTRIYRLSGDEFAFIVRHVSDIDEVRKLAEGLLSKFRASIEIAKTPLEIRCSIGVALYPDHGGDVATLLRNADVAMYSAKEEGGHRYREYSERIQTMDEKARLVEWLRKGVTDQEFELHYQPKIDTLTGKVRGAEALIRWRSKEHQRVVPPNEFIPLAEESGLIRDIGTWVLETACQQNKMWQDSGFPPLCMCVNVSMVQLEDPEFLDVVQRVLKNTGLDPQYLELEVTESVLVKNMERTSFIIDQLMSLGIRTAVDDFGVGYSSFHYLAHLHVKTLKLDRSFVQDLTTSPSVARIVPAIIQMAHALHMKVVAEGVEQKEQLDILKGIQCDQVQGFLFSRPQTQEKFQEYLLDAHEERFNIITSAVQ